MDSKKNEIFNVQGRIDELLNVPISSCAFTGHRDLEPDFSAEKLIEAIEKCIERGVKTFYCGMAKGFDMLAAEYVLLKKRQGAEIQLVACIPYPEQSKNFSDEDKGRYNRILNEVDDRYLACEAYRPWCMAQRNNYMVEKADVLIAYCHKDSGGSFNTIKRALQKKKSVIFV